MLNVVLSRCLKKSSCAIPQTLCVQKLSSSLKTIRPEHLCPKSVLKACSPRFQLAEFWSCANTLLGYDVYRPLFFVSCPDANESL